jgi:hypothetical protein
MTAPRAPSSLPKQVALTLLISCAVVAIRFLWEGYVGFSLWDEGFLWYGSQRVLQGEVPVRDFMSYDPGRYYWSAALMRILGDDGIITQRLAVAAFQVFGCVAALLVVSRSVSRADVAFIAMLLISVVAWMEPQYKLFDVAMSLLFIGIFVYVIQRPSRRNFFITGIWVGLSAVFGRNHGLYNVAAMLWIMLYFKLTGARLPVLFHQFIAFSGGIIVGYTPMLCMFVFVPRFFAAYWDVIRLHFEAGATNLPLPVPWPWLVPVTVYAPIIALREVLTGVFFVAIIPFGVLTTVVLFRHAVRGKVVVPEIAACAAISLPYAHYAFSRADLAHLTHSIFPFLVGIFVLIGQQPRTVRWPIAAIVTAASLLVTAQMHYGWNCRVGENNCVDTSVAGSELRIAPSTIADIAMLNSFVAEFAPHGTNFVVTPFWPGAYAIARRKSPMWEIYALFPRSENFQKAEIDRIREADPGFILVIDIALDGRDELRFRVTHPLIDQFIRDNFERLSLDSYPSQYQLYKRTSH